MTYKVLAADTKKIIYTSILRTATDIERQNLRAAAVKGEGKSDDKPIYIRDRRDKWKVSPEMLTAPSHLPSLNPDDLLGMTLLTPPEPDGQKFRARIFRKIIDGDREDPSHDNVKFILKIDGKKADEIVGYNEVVNHLNKQLADEFAEELADEKVWKFRRIVGRQGPLKPSDPRYLGSKWNVLVEWETGETTYEPLNV